MSLVKLFDVYHPDNDLEQIKKLLSLWKSGPNRDREFVPIVAEHMETLSAVHLYCILGDLDALKKTACKECSLEARDGHKGLTPFLYACLYGHLEVCKYLIDQKCNLYDTTNDGEMALHLACRSSSEKALNTIRFLVTIARCDVNGTTKTGHTPIMVLSEQNKGGTQIAEHFISECVCDLSLKTKAGNTALHLACMAGNLNIVQMILGTEAGSRSTMAFNKEGNLPLHLACWYGQHNCAKAVVRANSSGLYAMNNAGLIPLMIALDMYLEELVILLIRRMYLSLIHI